MARNINQIKQTNGFIAMSPQIATQWSNPKMAKTKSGTGDVGKIIPVFFRSMTPGEKFRIKQSANIQFVPFMSNLFHQIDGELVTYFCPDRLSTFKSRYETGNASMVNKYTAIDGEGNYSRYQAEDLWKNFITGGETGEPTTAASTLPKTNLKDLYNNTPAQDNNGNHLVQTLADYFQMKIKDYDEIYDNPVNSRLWHAYNYIYNECLRNPDFTAERSLNDNTVATAYWESDRFTHARKQQLRGEVPSVPLSDQFGRIFELAHNITTQGDEYMSINPDYANNADQLRLTDWGSAPGKKDGIALEGIHREQGTGNPTIVTTNNAVKVDNHSLTNIGINLNDLLTNLAIMKYETNNERMLPYYEEQLYYRFGIEKQDVRLNKPEIVYRENIGIGIETVTQTSAGGNATEGPNPKQSYQGNITSQGWGHGEGSGEYEIKEHGVLMTLMIIRPKGVYENGIERPWWGDIDRYDFITPELVDIPDVAIENQELYYTGNKEKDKKTFGYQAIYDEYRTMTNEVCGWLRPSVTGGLPTYTLARALDENVELNDSFLKCVPNMERIKQFTGANVPDFLFFVRTELWMAQPLPLINNPTTIM